MRLIVRNLIDYFKVYVYTIARGNYFLKGREKVVIRSRFLGLKEENYDVTDVIRAIGRGGTLLKCLGTHSILRYDVTKTLPRRLRPYFE